MTKNKPEQELTQLGKKLVSDINDKYFLPEIQRVFLGACPNS